MPEIAERLAPWFAERARDLPWRRDRTPYRVWVSEVMLQQTRVAVVVDYFQRFVARFPDVDSLAAATEGDVLSMWSGLGYYRRARALRTGAQAVVARGSVFPTSPEQLEEIPGIGPYTAGAIASLAFGVRAPLVDGNVTRVLCRLFAITADPTKGAGKKLVWQRARELVPANAPGAFNEALMELGATVCTPTRPQCTICPLVGDCEAARRGVAASLPALPPKKKPKPVFVGAVVVTEGDEILLGRRRSDALFGGLWEPPMVEAVDAMRAEAAARALVRRPRRVGDVEHVLTHRTMNVSVTRGDRRRAVAYPPVYEDVRMVAASELPSYGMSTLAKKVLGCAKGEG